MKKPETRAAELVAHQLASILFEQGPFRHRSLSHRTIGAVLASGIDAPERLLFMTQKQLRSIPRIGKTALREIEAYRERFVP